MQRRQCTNALMVGQIIMIGLAVNVENWANVIIGTFLVMFSLATRSWLERIDRQEKRDLIRASITTTYATITAPNHPSHAQSGESVAQSVPASPMTQPHHEPQPQGRTY